MASVEVLYTDDAGGQHEAQVDHAWVEGALAEELGLEEPFGYFVAFVPRETARSAEVIAYDADAEEIGRAVDRPPVVGEEPPPLPDRARIDPRQPAVE